MSCLGMKYPQIFNYLESLEREFFDHTVLLRYCAILLETIGMNFFGMNYSQNIICSGFIESLEKFILCILDTVLYSAF